MDIKNIKIIRSDRKTLALQILRDGTPVVRAPLYTSEKDIKHFIESNSEWLEKHIKKVNKQIEEAQKNKLSYEEIKALADKALDYIPKRCAYFAPLVGVTYGRITIRNQKSKWGSCSSKGNLNFNCLLMLMPEKVIDAVIVHELCHRKEMNHSDRFYAEVLRVMPDYHEHNRWLKQHGGEIMSRML